MGQVAGIFGVDAGSGTTLEKFANTLRAIAAGDTSTATLAGLDRGPRHHRRARRVNKKIPGALIAVVGSIVLSEVLDLAAKGVTTLGAIQGGLPGHRPAAGRHHRRDNIVALLPIVISIFVVILAQSAATSRAYAMQVRRQLRRERRPGRPGRWPASVPACRARSSVNGSPTKTEMVDSAGGRSQLSQLTAGRDRRRRPAVPDRSAGQHAQRGPGLGGLPDRDQAHRLQGDERHPAGSGSTSSWSRC